MRSRGEQEVVAFKEEILVRQPRPVAGSDTGVLGYLEALTYDFEREGQQVSCILIYAQPDPSHPGQYQFVPADDTGYEGIACVDDTARAALLALAVYERNHSRKALTLARRWLTFVEYMQYPDGEFANFIRNAAGVRNASGPTSVKGGYAWSMRALWALARAYRLIGERSYLERFLACELAPTEDNKVNAVLALANLEMYRADPTPQWRERVMTHVEPIHASAGDYFRDLPGQDEVHLWGYHQLHAVVSASRELGEEGLIASCRSTVRSLLEPDVRARFWYSYPDLQKDGVCAYVVAPVVQGLGELYRATGIKKYCELAIRGAAWFYGRNDARTAMYDPTTGMCRDGITHDVASLNYGAESSIEAGFAELERRSLFAGSS